MGGGEGLRNLISGALIAVRLILKVSVSGKKERTADMFFIFQRLSFCPNLSSRYPVIQSYFSSLAPEVCAFSFCSD